MIFSADDGCDVGRDTGSPVSPDYGPHGNEFTGQVKGVQIDDRRGGREPGPSRLSGGMRPVAMARQ